MCEPGGTSGSWDDAAAFLAALPDEDRARVSSLAALGLPDDEAGIAATLAAYAGENPAATPASFLAVTGARTGAAGEPGLARTLGRAALDLAGRKEDRGLAHACLAQTHFKDRRDAAELAAFVEHCREAVRLGHAGTFCYERLAVLHEYRGEREEAAEVCRRAVEVLEASGDHRSAAGFRKRLDRLARR